jgi:integrase
MGALTIETLIAFRQGPACAAMANSTWAKYHTVLGQFCEWATDNGHLPANPWRTARARQLKVLRRGKPAQRNRRISTEELHSLFAAASAHARRGKARYTLLLTAAFETALRIGELLAVQWRHIHWEQRQLWIPALEAGARKTGSARFIPLTARLIDALTANRLDPAGEPFAKSAYVFGNDVGERVQSIGKWWDTTVLRAHGVSPRWINNNKLDAAALAAKDRIDLHFHDIRHEAACRWHESGVPLTTIKEILGHASVAQTAPYVHADETSVRAAMDAFEAARDKVGTKSVQNASQPLANERAQRTGTH